jgi:hypothetical protein
MRYAVRLMVIVSAVVGLGAGLLAAALVGLAEAWVVAGNHSVTYSPDGRAMHEYRPAASETRPILAGWGAGLLAVGLTFLALLGRLTGPDPSRGKEGQGNNAPQQRLPPIDPA